jgi:hypothetical protein
MNVLVDSSVWSLALRRNTTNEAIAIVKVLRDLIADGRVVLLGAIRHLPSKRGNCTNHSGSSCFQKISRMRASCFEIGE